MASRNGRRLDGMVLRILLVAAAGLVLAGSTAVLEEVAEPVAAGDPDIGYAESVLAVQLQPDVEGDPVVLVVGSPYWDDGVGRLWQVTLPSGPDWDPLPGDVLTPGPEAGSYLGRKLAAGDFNGDDFTDLVATGGSGSQLRLFVSWGGEAGWSAAEQFFDIPCGAPEMASMTVSDMDGDGLDDLAVGCPTWLVSYVQFFPGNVGLTVGEVEIWGGDPPDIWANNHQFGGALEAGIDWNCDGHPDLATGASLGPLWVLLNPTDEEDQRLGWVADDGPLGEVGAVTLQLPGNVRDTTSFHDLGDVTGDGCQDILVISEAEEGGRGEVRVIEGRSTEEWLALGAEPGVEDVAIWRRRGRFPLEGVGAAAVPVWWSQPQDPGGPIAKPDLLVGAPAGFSADGEGAAPGFVLFLEADALWGAAGLPVPEDLPGQEPEALPDLRSLAALRLESLADGAQLGAGLALVPGVADEEALSEVVISAPGWRFPDGAEDNGAVFRVAHADLADLDGDGVYGLLDCDDDDATVYPGAPEACGGLDEDCDGLLGPVDVDDDADGVTECDGDCDDADDTRYWGAPELCGGLDEDCDGALGPAEIDDDADWISECDGDCDDSDATVYPGAAEVCGGQDEDCDGLLGPDELDDDGDGVSECDGDCDDADSGRYPGNSEACDGLDGDCDGAPDPSELDRDGDGVRECAGDCDDLDPKRHPGAAPVADMVDTDCDGVADWPGGWLCALAVDGRGGAGTLVASLLLLSGLWRRRVRSSGSLATPGHAWY